MDSRHRRSRSQVYQSNHRNISSPKHSHINIEGSPGNLPRALSLPIVAKTSTMRKCGDDKESGDLIEIRGRFEVMRQPCTTSLVHQLSQLLRSSLAQREQLTNIIHTIDPDVCYDCKSYPSSLGNNYKSEQASAREYELVHMVIELQEKVALLTNEVKAWTHRNHHLEKELYAIDLRIT